LGTRMTAAEGGGEVAVVHGGVDLGGGDAGVAEHFLYGAQVGAALEEVGGEGMAQGMGAGMRKAGAAREVAHLLPDALARQRPPTRRHEDEGATSTVQQRRPRFLMVAPEPF